MIDESSDSARGIEHPDIFLNQSLAALATPHSSLFQSQIRHSKPGSGHDPVTDLGHEVLFEILVHAPRLGAEIAVVRDVGCRGEIQHFRTDPERDAAHQPLQFVELLEAGDLLVVVAAHDGVFGPERAEGWAEDGDIEKPELREDVHRAMRQWRAGKR